MKFILLIHFFILNICFGQFFATQNTGVITNKGQSQFGLWLQSSEEWDDGTSRAFASVAFEYYMPFGIEIGMAKHNNSQGTGTRTSQNSFSYHFKISENKNFSITFASNERIRDNYKYILEQYKDRYEAQRTSLKWYNNKGLFIEIGKYSYENNNYFTLTEGSSWNDYAARAITLAKAAFITIGRYERLNDWLILGANYSRINKPSYDYYQIINLDTGSISTNKPNSDDFDLVGISLGFLF